MKCNYKPTKLTKVEKQEMASTKSTLPYIDRLQIEHRNTETKRTSVSLVDGHIDGEDDADNPSQEDWDGFWVSLDRLSANTLIFYKK